MRILVKYGFSLTIMVLLQTAFSAFASQGEVVVLTDRTFALSGDTVWFTVSCVQDASLPGNVIHVLLENRFGKTVKRVMVVTVNGTGDGYMPLPDSLSTGIYHFRPLISSSRGKKEFTASALCVINRFDETVESIAVRNMEVLTTDQSLPEVSLHISREYVAPGDEFEVNILLPDTFRQSVRELVISVGLAIPGFNPGPAFYSERFYSGNNADHKLLPPESDGFFMEGWVRSSDGLELPAKSMVLLSISDTIPYFDYYMAGQDGYFRFNLKNIYGEADIYLQAIGDDGRERSVSLVSDFNSGGEKDDLTFIRLNEDAQRFAGDMLQAALYERIFTGDHFYRSSRLIRKDLFPEPFFGVPDMRVVPAEFMELPDFTEISRELLPGVRLRHRNGEIAVQVLDLGGKSYFNNSPLRLINGIPIFSEKLLSNLKSSDILYIDLVRHERIFGDISFKGIVSVVLREKGLGWLSEQKGLYEFHIPCLQIPVKSNFQRDDRNHDSGNLPDLRRVFLFERINLSEESHRFTVRTSDLKGHVYIRLAGVTHQGNPFELIKKVMVK